MHMKKPLSSKAWLLFFGILRDPAIQAEFIYRQF